MEQLLLDNWKTDQRQAPKVEDGLNYLIGGEIRTWKGPSVEVKSCIFQLIEGKPFRSTLGYAPLLDEKEVLSSLEAAEKAWDNGKGVWPTMSVEKRIQCVQNFLIEMKAVREDVVERIMWEIGKTYDDSVKEFDRTVQYIEDTIQALKQLDRMGAEFKIEGNFLAQIRYAPLGITLCMGPYNYPLNETFTTMIPALIMGNPVISKLPRFGQLLNTPLLKAFQKSFPAGVINIINGRGNTIIGPLISSGKVTCVSFIGSSKTADVVKKYHPRPHRLRTILSLDAKNLGVVLKDADMNVTIPQLIAGALGFNGQRCTAIKMIYVHSSRKDELIEKLTEAIKGMKAGFPWTSGVKLTPIADLNAINFLKDILQDALDKGAKIMNPNGGEYIENYMYPAILFPVDSSMKVFEVEQFGPIIPIKTFEDIEEVIDYTVESDFGQQVSLFGYDPVVQGKLIDAMANQISRINLNVQCQRGPDSFPFTGRKASAEGTLSVTEALTVFSVRSLVATDMSQPNKKVVQEILDQRTSSFLNRDFIF